MICVAGSTPIRPGPRRDRLRDRENPRIAGQGVRPAGPRVVPVVPAGTRALGGPRDTGGRGGSRPVTRAQETASTPHGAARQVLFRRQPPNWRVRHPPGAPLMFRLRRVPRKTAVVLVLLVVLCSTLRGAAQQGH